MRLSGPVRLAFSLFGFIIGIIAQMMNNFNWCRRSPRWCFWHRQFLLATICLDFWPDDAFQPGWWVGFRWSFFGVADVGVGDSLSMVVP